MINLTNLILKFIPLFPQYNPRNMHPVWYPGLAPAKFTQYLSGLLHWRWIIIPLSHWLPPVKQPWGMWVNRSHPWLSGKLCYLQHNRVGDTIVYHQYSDMDLLGTPHITTTKQITTKVVHGLYNICLVHYNDVIMSAMTSYITSLTIVYSSVYSRRRSKKTS